MITRWLISLLSTRLGRWIWLLLLKKATFLLPLKRLRETDTLVAFLHPKPSYAFHAVLVPKENVLRFTDLKADNSAFLLDLVLNTQKIITEHNLKQGGYRLIVNGGSYQDFPHLHFHLVADQNKGKEK